MFYSSTTTGCRIVEMSCEEHDRHAAGSQFITHTIGRGNIGNKMRNFLGCGKSWRQPNRPKGVKGAQPGPVLSWTQRVKMGGGCANYSNVSFAIIHLLDSFFYLFDIFGIYKCNSTSGHEVSYNPSVEYIPTEEEKNAYQLMFEEDPPKFIPRRFESLRSVTAYDMAVKEVFDRCLDLYLCPRSRKKRLNIDPESLKPKLPSRKDLRPYPTTCYLEYRGHTGAIKSLSVEISGQWLASGSTDGTVRVWEVETGRCLKVWDVGESVQHVYDLYTVQHVQHVVRFLPPL